MERVAPRQEHKLRMTRPAMRRIIDSAPLPRPESPHHCGNELFTALVRQLLKPFKASAEIAGGVFFTGNIAVTCDGKKVLCQDTSRKIRVVDVESKTGSVFMTYSDDMQHIQASKTDPDLFSLINQSAGSTTARIVICDLSKGDYAAFESDSEPRPCSPTTSIWHTPSGTITDIS